MDGQTGRRDAAAGEGGRPGHRTAALVAHSLTENPEVLRSSMVIFCIDSTAAVKAAFDFASAALPNSSLYAE